MNRYSPCVPVSRVRSSFDSLLARTTVAPAIALPLGSVTVPCREVDEVCGKTVPLKVNTTKIDKSRNLARFMVPPWQPTRMPLQQWAADKRIPLFRPPLSHTSASVRIGLRQGTSVLRWKLVWERHELLRFGSVPGNRARAQMSVAVRDRRQ